MIKVYGSSRTRAFRVLWLLEEMGVEYEHVDVSFADGEHLSEEFLKLNPSAKVPVLIVDDVVYHETSMMLYMLADKYGKGTPLELAADDSKYKILQWLFYGADELEQGLWTAARHKFALPKERRIKEAIDWGFYEFEKALDYLSTMLGDKTYLVAESFSIADIQISQILMWAVSQQKLDLKYDNVRAYHKRARSREGFKKTVALARS